MITAQNAAEYSRDVWVVPGPVDTGRSRGGHKLVQDGAALADSPNDVLRALGKPVGDEPQILLALRAQPSSEAKTPRPRRAVVAPIDAPMRPPAVPIPAPPPANLSPDESALLAGSRNRAAPFGRGVRACRTFRAANVGCRDLADRQGVIKQLPGNLYVRV